MSKIKLEVGMEVYCAVNGKGVIEGFDEDDELFINVRSEKGAILHYYKGGNFGLTYAPTLKPLNVPFTVGMEVECLIYGKGRVESVMTERVYNIYVVFDNGRAEDYTQDGRIHSEGNQTLFPQFTI